MRERKKAKASEMMVGSCQGARLTVSSKGTASACVKLPHSFSFSLLLTINRANHKKESKNASKSIFITPLCAIHSASSEASSQCAVSSFLSGGRLSSGFRWRPNSKNEARLPLLLLASQRRLVRGRNSSTDSASGLGRSCPRGRSGFRPYHNKGLGNPYKI